jgi:hypothetical protein
MDFDDLELRQEAEEGGSRFFIPLQFCLLLCASSSFRRRRTGAFSWMTN